MPHARESLCSAGDFHNEELATGPKVTCTELVIAFKLKQALTHGREHHDYRAAPSTKYIPKLLLLLLIISYSALFSQAKHPI